jgi:hypothetical protein
MASMLPVIPFGSGEPHIQKSNHLCTAVVRSAEIGIEIHKPSIVFTINVWHSDLGPS